MPSQSITATIAIKYIKWRSRHGLARDKARIDARSSSGLVGLAGSGCDAGADGSGFRPGARSPSPRSPADGSTEPLPTKSSGNAELYPDNRLINWKSGKNKIGMTRIMRKTRTTQRTVSTVPANTEYERA
jgi:hypothetical protein